MDSAAALPMLSIEELLAPLLVQLLVIVLFGRMLATLAHRVGQPAVVGEIIAGLLLGPTCFKRLMPGLWDTLFRPTMTGISHELSDPLFVQLVAVISQLGLIFLMLQIGLEFEWSKLRMAGRSAAGISTAGIILPFALGVCVATMLHGFLEPHPTAGPIPRLGFTLFLGAALSITAIPVLARILLELNITRTRIGTTVVAAAALGDATGWIIMATVAGVVRTGFDFAALAWTTVATICFAFIMFALVGPVLRNVLSRSMSVNGLTIGGLSLLIAASLASAVATGRIGIFAILGPFVLGAVLSPAPGLREAVAGRMRDLVNAFFLPVFFTSTGLRTDVGSLGEYWQYGGAALILVAAVAGKYVGCGLAARWGGFTRREAGCIGVLMNARGLMELIVVNQGYELGVIPPSVYTMLVVMAVVTTMMTTPLLMRMSSGTELETPLREAGWLNSPASGKVASLQ